MLELPGIQFQNSSYLYLLCLVPLSMLLWRLALGRKRRFRRELFQDRLAEQKSRRTSTLSWMGLVTFKNLAFTVVLLFLIAALARPQVRREQVIEERQGLDMVILLDLSYSMLAEDIIPSRLEKAKQVIRDFIIRKRDEDRISLVMFSETSLILSYLTQDPENLLFYFDYLRPQYGTNIGRAIKSGLRVFEREDEVNAGQQLSRLADPNNRVIILLSDGEDHGDELDQAMTASGLEKIKIYCIGIGSRKAVPIPVGLDESGMRQYLQGQDGNQVYSRFRENTLREIARRTGARFYRAFIGYEMAQAFQDIARKESKINDFKIVTQYQDIYYYLLVGSLGLFFVLLTLD